jgi:hypothetical protein
MKRSGPAGPNLMTATVRASTGFSGFYSASRTKAAFSFVVLQATS